MKRLVEENQLATKLPNCSQNRILQPQDVLHEQFCCRKSLVTYFDGNNDEVATVIEQIHANAAKGITRTFTQIRIGNDVYRLRLP